MRSYEGILVLVAVTRLDLRINFESNLKQRRTIPGLKGGKYFHV